MTEQQAHDKGLIQIACNDHHGIYIPKVFCESYYKYIRIYAKSLSSKDGADFLDNVIICSEGPNHPEYWDAWEIILNALIITDDTGIKHTIMQDGDVWFVQKDADIVWDEN